MQPCLHQLSGPILPVRFAPQIRPFSAAEIDPETRRSFSLRWPSDIRRLEFIEEIPSWIETVAVKIETVFIDRMDSFIASISNREWASLIWLGGLIVWVAYYKPTRKSVGQLLKAFFQPVLIVPLLIAAVYATGEIHLLDRIGWWSIDNLKTTVLWLITFAFVTMFEVAMAKNRKAGLGKITRDIVAVTGVLIFITELYSFSLPVELIALPLVTIIYLMAEMAKLKPEHVAVAKLFGYLSALIGFSYFGFSVWKSVEAGREAATWAVALEFLNPVMLSVGFLPFLYIWRTYVAYNETFTTISVFGIDKSLVSYARWLAIIHIRSDLDLLERWRKSIRSSRPANKTELKNTLTALLALKEREAAPLVVQPRDGWSPYLAIQFMAGMSVETGYYHQTLEDEWFAQSSMRELGNGFGLNNNLAYYVNGTEHAVTSVKIKLNINDPATAEAAENLFTAQAMHLLEQAVSFNAVERLSPQIASLEPFEADIPFGAVTLRRDEFTGIKGGYDRVFEIKRGQS